MESGPKAFDEVEFKQRFNNLFRAWRAEWVAGTRGPQRIYERTRRLLSRKRLEVNRPEEEAYHAFLDYCSEVIVSAVKVGGQNEAIAAIEDTLLTLELHDHVKLNIFSDLVHMTLDKFSALEK